MRVSIRNLCLALVTTLSILPARAAERLTVVELFTSQGCSSCPPAEALLVDLSSHRTDVLALAFHVDYWDRLGWKDPYSSAAATQRQSQYAADWGGDQVYTPQMVVDGQKAAVGSDREAVNDLIKAATAGQAPQIAIHAVRKGRSVTIDVGKGTGSAKLLLIGFDPKRETAILRGENAGRTIVQANIVRSVDVVADWQGLNGTFGRTLGHGQEAAVLLQAADGRILGATHVKDASAL